MLCTSRPVSTDDRDNCSPHCRSHRRTSALAAKALWGLVSRMAEDNQFVEDCLALGFVGNLCDAINGAAGAFMAPNEVPHGVRGGKKWLNRSHTSAGEHLCAFFKLNSSFYPSTSSTPKCPCRFFILERYKLCSKNIRTDIVQCNAVRRADNART